MHQTPFYVLPTLGHDSLLTLPGGELINGLRNAVTSHERNAIQIAQRHQLAVKGLGCLVLPENSDTKAYGYIVEPAYRTKIPEYADLTSGHIEPDHNFPLELHDSESLLEHLKDQPNRSAETTFLRAFGSYILRRSR
jgi:hypothetical protein